MLMLHDDVRAYLIVGVLAVATVLTGWPKAEGADKPNATVAEAADTKSPKKTKRKGVATPQKVKSKTPEVLLWPGSMFWGRPSEGKKGILVHPVRATGPMPQDVPPPAEYPQDKSARARIRKVLKTAKEQLGDPYRYGSRGPDSFDCSGFVQYVWSQAGIQLPRTSGAQYASLPKVPLDKLKPGDLLYRPGHIGMYWGNGKMIHSPQSGGNVEIVPVHGGDAGARVLEREPAH
jgi:cell wall-associated NlpC family hydrolase